MLLRRNPYSTWFLSAPVVIVLSMSGCDGSGVDPGEPGSLEVAVSTEGELQDPSGYSLLLNGVAEQDAVEVNDVILFEDLPAGEHVLQLDDIARNCAVEGDNPRTVEVPAGGLSRTEFMVVCVAPQERVIAFSRFENGVGDIWIMDEDGSGQVNVTRTSSMDIRPMTSRDGSRIAFQSDRDGATDVWTMLVDGSGARNLTSSSSTDEQPAWFADGEELVFVSNREGSDDLWVMDADGGNADRLTDSQGDDRAPAVSPDGSRIAFTSDRGGSWDIWVLDLQSNELANLTNSTAEDLRPAWFPDGSRVAFFSDRTGAYDVWLMDADGGNPVNLTNSPDSDDGEPAVSLDGTRIAFNSDREGGPCEPHCGPWRRNGDIWVMDIDGSNLRNLTRSPDTHEEDAAWES